MSTTGTTRFWEDFFLELGLGMMNRIVIAMETAECRFQAFYGTYPFIAAILWYEITIAHPWMQRQTGCQPEHLLWLCCS